MKQPQKKTARLLKLIPQDRLSSQQKALRPTAQGAPLYKLLREPTHLNEFNRKKYRDISIWRDNGTIICIGDNSNERYQERTLCFVCSNFENRRENNMLCAIYGKTDAAIATTAVFFWSLHYRGNNYNCLEIFSCRSDDDDRKFNFAALQPEQLARVLDANPKRVYELISETWTTEQSVVLATRPYPLALRLLGPSWRWKNVPVENYGGFAFEDQGAAFVEALEKRQSSFGWLYIDIKPECFAFSSENFKRLLKLDVIAKLSLSVLAEEFALLPFSAKAKCLNYTIDARDVEPEDFEALDILPKDLRVSLSLENTDEWQELMISLLNRVADLGHFDKLSLSLDFFGHLDDGIDEIPVVPALIRAIRANPKLTCLDLSGACFTLDQAPYLEHIFQAVEEHEGLRTLILYEYPTEFYAEGNDPDRPCQPDYFLLERLLSRNRNLKVLDYYGNRCSDGHSIDRLYLLNAFYHGSARLMKEWTSLRPLLVATALTESASGDFQFSVLLLSNHTDMLCELMDGVNLDALYIAEIQTEETVARASGASHQTITDRSKRKTLDQPSNAAKKTARKET